MISTRCGLFIDNLIADVETWLAPSMHIGLDTTQHDLYGRVIGNNAMRIPLHDVIEISSSVSNDDTIITTKHRANIYLPYDTDIDMTIELQNIDEITDDWEFYLVFTQN